MNQCGILLKEEATKVKINRRISPKLFPGE